MAGCGSLTALARRWPASSRTSGAAQAALAHPLLSTLKPSQIVLGAH